MAVRKSILAQHEKGTSISSIARGLHVSRGTVYSILKRYQSEGVEGLKPKYGPCGKPRPGPADFVFRAVRCLKTWHPGWGSDKIHAELLFMRPDLSLPHPRTFYRWFRWNGQTKTKSKPPKVARRWAKQVHEGWQIDAKEAICIADGSKQCWLNIKDERSGAVMDPPVFPPQEDL